MKPLIELAQYIHERNAADAKIAELIGRPAQRGHIGEFIAAEIFDIELHQSATEAGSDGVFRSGELAGNAVNIKFYGKQEGILDINPNHVCDHYLVLCGPPRPLATSLRSTRPLVIQWASASEGRG